MAEEGARLIATLEARVSKFEKDLARANGTARREFGSIERRGQEMSRRLESSVAAASSGVERRLAGISKSFSSAGMALKAGLTGFLAGAASEFSLSSVKATIGDLAKLNDVAERTGASSDFLQAFAYAVRQSGGEAEDAAAGMQKFGVNISKAAAGSGDLAKVFESNGVAITDAAGKMRPIEDLLGDFAELVKNAGSEQDRLNLSTMAFGRGAGPALVLALAGGRAGLADLEAAARKAGAVLSGKLVKQAAELDDKFADLEDRINGLGRRFAVEFGGPVVEAAMNVMLGKLEEIRDTIDAIRNMDLGKIGAFLMSRTGPGALMSAVKPDAPKDDRADLPRLEAKAAELQAQIAKLTETSNPRAGALISKLKMDLAEIEERVKRINAMPVGNFEPSRIGYTTGGRRTIVPGEGGGKGGDTLGGGDAIRDFVRQVVKAESGGRADAKNPNSTATGAGQFIESTWLALFRKHYPEAAAKMGTDAILALRTDADISKEMIEAYAKENAEALRQAGQAVTSANLHLAHFLGPGGAISTLQAPAGAPTSSFLGADQIAANRSILAGKTREDVLAYADRRAETTRVAAGDLTAEEEKINRKAEAVKRVVDALNLETAAIGQNELQRRIAQELQSAGVDLETKEGQAIAAKVTQLQALKTAQEAATRSAEQLRDAREEFAKTGADAAKSFVQDLRNGESAADALLSALDRIVDKLLNSVIDMAFNSLFNVPNAGGGGLAQGLMSLFAGARAAGGPVSPGRAYIVGEKRPEVFVPNTAGRILSRVPEAPAAAKLGSFAKPVVNVTAPPTTVNVIGAPAGARVEERDDGRRGRSIDVILDEKAADAISRPGSASSQALRSNYGARPVIRKLG